MRISSEGEKRRGGIARFFTTLLILFLIVYVCLFFAVRMDGAREIMAERLSKVAGCDLVIEKSRLIFPLSLSLCGVRSTNTGSAVEGSIEIGEIKIRPAFSSLMKLSVSDGRITLVRDNDGGWFPRFFDKVGDLPLKDMDAVSGVTAGFRKRIAVDVSDVSIVWSDAEGGRLAYAEDIAFVVRPVKIPGNSFYFYRLGVYRLQVPGVSDGVVREMFREWLASDEVAYLEIGKRAGESPADKPPAGDR